MVFVAHTAYKFRLYPTVTQAKALGLQLETLRRVYNDALQIHRDVYAATGKSPKVGYANRVIILSRNAQRDDAKHGRGGPKWLTQVAAVPIRDVCARVQRAFDNFFRRLKMGEKPGYPRFKSYGRLTSIPFDNYGSVCQILGPSGNPLNSDMPAAQNGCRLHLFGVGDVRVLVHRAVVGAIKMACVEREPDGKWYVILTAQTPDREIASKVGPAVGIDVGLEHFLVTSDGEFRPNPRHLKNNLKALRRLQRSASRKTEAAKKRKAKFRECKNLQKSFRNVARLHVRVRNLRKEHHHQEANRLVHRCGIVCVEKLNIRGMVRNNKLSRSIMDAAWGGFLITLKHKAAKAGVRFVEVNPAGTSQTCPLCWNVVPKKLKDRKHDCPYCGYYTNRDRASAKVILARGLEAIGVGSTPAVDNLCVSGGLRRSPVPSEISTVTKRTNRSRGVVKKPKIVGSG